MNLRQAAQRALKAMEDGEYRADMIEFSDALIALRAALAEPEQEPVAWVLVTPYGEEDDIFYTEPQSVPDGWSYKPLYDTAPTPRKPLTDEQISVLWDGHTVPVFDKTGINPIVFARAIERHHGIGEQQ